MSARLVPTLLLLTIAFGPARSAEPSAEGLEFFEKKVRPLLAENCQRCHGADKQKGNLRLDSRAGLLKGGDTGAVVVPGDPERSLLVKAVRYQDELRMPPKTRLTDAAIADLAAWVKMGVPWPDDRATTAVKGDFNMQERLKHWCWQPVKAVTPPDMQRRDWPLSPIDSFILARLEAAGLAPAPGADKPTLLRRVTFDLTGLPPTATEIDAFLRDDSPDAFARVVDRLLASPHYGERWGRHWLDLMRYAETYGHEFDFEIPHASQYRDYVIRAFNDDLPYDQLVVEHIAGDLLPRPRRNPDGSNESVLGTGFWFLGEAKHSPVDVRGDESDRVDNQIDVLTKAFLGLTVTCARCHDHKFDAISQKDYHALMGYLHSSRFDRTFLDAPERTAGALRELTDLQAQARSLAVTLNARVLQSRLERLAPHLRGDKGDAATAERWTKARSKPEALFAGWLGAVPAEQFITRRKQLVDQWKAQAARAAEEQARCTVFADFKQDAYQDWFPGGPAFTAPTRAPVALLQPEGRQPVRALVPPGTAHSGLTAERLAGVLRSKSFLIPKSKVFYHAAGRGARVNLVIDNFQLIRAPIYGGLTFELNNERLGWHVQDVSMWVGHRAYIEVLDEGAGYAALDRVLFSDGGPPAEAPNAVLLAMLDDDRLATPEMLAQKYQDTLLQIVRQWSAGELSALPDAADRVTLLNALLQSEAVAALDGAASGSDEDRQKLSALLERHKQVEAAMPAPHRALAMADGNPVDAHVYIRGNPNKFGDVVPRRTLTAFGADDPAPATGSGRLELARSLVRPTNPLTARVLVNRLWHHHFGAGLVRSVDNFGVLGETPTHPELLDWLATEFIRQGWSVKKLHRLILLSRTYQMASRGDPTAEERDAKNELLHRMPLRRLEAEAIRDAMLAVSGRLDRRVYGASVMPHLTPHMAGRGRPGASGPLDGDGRRSVYVNVRRNFLSPLFLAFDYPVPFTTMGRRTVSNVPAQALALMNNPFVVQQAERWAQRARATPGQDAKQRITAMYVDAFGRPPGDTELAEALAFLDEQGRAYGKADDPRTWTDLAHVLFNVKEFIFVN